MREYVGVMSWLGAVTTKSFPKREVLLFNRIAVPYLRLGIQMLEQSDNPNEDFINELESLLQEGIIFEPKIVFSHKLRANLEYAGYRDLSSKLQNEMLEFIKNPDLKNITDDALNAAVIEVLKVIESGKRSTDSLSPHAFYLLNGFIDADYEARRISVQLRELDNIQAFPILLSDFYSVQKEQADKTDVVEIVLKALPVPDDSVSWEQLKDFRNDPDSVGDLLSLKTWMNKIVRDKFSPIEVEEELEEIISRYRKHLKLHRIKVNTVTMKTIVSAKADIIPNLIKLKWGKVAEALFVLKERRITLLEGELNTPGREIAYIVKAQERLS